MLRQTDRKVDVRVEGHDRRENQIPNRHGQQKRIRVDVPEEVTEHQPENPEAPHDEIMVLIQGHVHEVRRPQEAGKGLLGGCCQCYRGVGGRGRQWVITPPCWLRGTVRTSNDGVINNATPCLEDDNDVSGTTSWVQTDSVRCAALRFSQSLAIKMF